MKQAQVIYYLFRAGTMEQPHSIDVAYLECTGLLLKDFKRRLNATRGRRMADSFAWSYKRNYKDDFLWHDVSDNDAILPTLDAEFIIKGCEILESECTKESVEPDDSCEVENKNAVTTAPTRTEVDKRAEDDGCETIKIYRRKTGLGHGSDATTQTDTTQAEEDEQEPSRTWSCRGEKPVADARRRVAPVPEVFDLLSCSKALNSQVPPAKATRGSSSFRHMLRCGGDIKAVQDHRQQQQHKHKQQQQQVQQEKEDLSSLFSGWMHNSNWRGKLVPLAFPKTTTRGRNGIYGTPTSNRTISRYRPRNSFSNSDYFEHGCYDIQSRPEKVKEVIESTNTRPRWSTECLLYDNDNRRRYGEPEPAAVEEGMSVSSRIISKLVQANETDKDGNLCWQEGVRTPTNHESMPRRSSLDWEKNLQEAVNMIIRSPAGGAHDRKQQQLL